MEWEQMKFSEFEEEQWIEFNSFFDTVVIPITGLCGDEPPWRVKHALEQLKEALDPIETLYKGRTVTYPAVHYGEDQVVLGQIVNQLCNRLQLQGFKHCIIVTTVPKLLQLQIIEASLIIGPEQNEANSTGYRTRVKQQIESLWSASVEGKHA
jgi:23S rRNA (pseudouridine1915-N3)-methyltransferase